MPWKRKELQNSEKINALKGEKGKKEETEAEESSEDKATIIQLNKINKIDTQDLKNLPVMHLYYSQKQRDRERISYRALADTGASANVIAAETVKDWGL